MHSVVVLLAASVAFLHLAIFVLESFLWTTPFGRRIFRINEAQAAATRALAQNQGVYNLFLAAGIVWSLGSGSELLPRATFFLLCVVIAGAVGAMTVSSRILLVQTVPAAAALVALWLT